MPTCRTCNSAHYVRSCPMIGTKRRAEVWPDEEDCYYHEPRKTPLLVDALALSLEWLLNLHHNVSKGGSEYLVTHEEWKEALDEGMRIHARYKEEVGDSPQLIRRNIDGLLIDVSGWDLPEQVDEWNQSYGRCSKCGMPWEIVRPGKGQPACECADTTVQQIGKQ